MRIFDDNWKQKLPQEIAILIYSFIKDYISLDVCLDGCYPTKRNSLECTVTIISRRTNKPLWIKHVKKARGNTPPNHKDYFYGASKCMEGFALESILQNLSQVKIFNTFPIIWATYVHDKDGCARNIISKYMPQAYEINDANHVAICFGRAITKIHKG